MKSTLEFSVKDNTKKIIFKPASTLQIVQTLQFDRNSGKDAIVLKVLKKCSCNNYLIS